MKKIKQAVLAAAAVGLMAGASVAGAASVSVTSASFNPDSGYGQDGCEICGKLLDVRFSNSAFSTQEFSLNAGESKTFAIGTVDFRERDAYGGINGSEIDNLGIRASLGFSIPGGASDLNFEGGGVAHTGAVSDANVDYTLSWLPRQISLGSGGLLEISFNELSFSGAGIQTLMATIKYLESGQQPVPEPGTMALLGLGLAGFGLARRKKSA